VKGRDRVVRALVDRVRRDREASDRMGLKGIVRVPSGQTANVHHVRNGRNRSDRFGLWRADAAGRRHLRKNRGVGLIRWSALPFFHARRIHWMRLFFPKLAFAFKEFREYPPALGCHDPAGDLNGMIQPRIVQ
jgi:hypothetical protein